MFTTIQVRATLSVLLAAAALAFVPSAPFALRSNVESEQTYLSAYADESGVSGSIQVEKLGISNVSKSSLPPSTLPNGGKISMVGSGPGDPDLLTMAAYRMITDPDVLIISDRLVSKEILDLIKGEVKIARKLPGCADAAQDEIYEWCKEGLDAGKHVIRLKIGDPFVFGRGGEEVLKFRDYGVEPKVIPGVSAAFSAPLLGSIPVTHRGVSNQVVMCTGYGRNGTSPDLIQYHKEQTIVFLMAVGRLRILCERLIDMAGYPSKTPVGIIQNAGCPNQRTVVGNMETIADLAEEYQVKAPSTIVVGEVVNVLLESDAETGEAVVGLIQNMTATEV
jgi:uroporphyrin-III C-methyltransferase